MALSGWNAPGLWYWKMDRAADGLAGALVFTSFHACRVTGRWFYLGLACSVLFIALSISNRDVIPVSGLAFFGMTAAVSVTMV